MKFHHIGMAVKNIEEYYEDHLKLFGFKEITATQVLDAQNVRVAYAINADGVKIELIEALVEDSPSINVLKRKHGGLYHLGFTPKDFMQDIELLKNKRFRVVSLKEDVAFLLAPTKELYEIIEE
ncbi:VOC family protein [Paenibacillus tundrae]|uniref:VOC family protein n=1 Tax=Paenibacillus tundrae TaxID=528187 RepID=UPI0022A9E593|nr:VOC family protein [Paenibacillus tundrae]MCZ1264744.1 hypothetical protein [Paenibacillus tundrae]